MFCYSLCLDCKTGSKILSARGEYLKSYHIQIEGYLIFFYASINLGDKVVENDSKNN